MAPADGRRVDQHACLAHAATPMPRPRPLPPARSSRAPRRRWSPGRAAPARPGRSRRGAVRASRASGARLRQLAAVESEPERLDARGPEVEPITIGLARCGAHRAPPPPASRRPDRVDHEARRLPEAVEPLEHHLGGHAPEPSRVGLDHERRRDQQVRVARSSKETSGSRHRRRAWPGSRRGPRVVRREDRRRRIGGCEHLVDCAATPGLGRRAPSARDPRRSPPRRVRAGSRRSAPASSRAWRRSRAPRSAGGRQRSARGPRPPSRCGFDDDGVDVDAFEGGRARRRRARARCRRGVGGSPGAGRRSSASTRRSTSARTSFSCRSASSWWLAIAAGGRGRPDELDAADQLAEEGVGDVEMIRPIAALGRPTPASARAGSAGSRARAPPCALLSASRAQRRSRRSARATRSSGSPRPARRRRRASGGCAG